MATLDASIVNIALPTIFSSFHTSLVVAEWVLEAYLLTITVLLLPFGRLAEMFGRKKVYAAAFAVVGIGASLARGEKKKATPATLASTEKAERRRASI